MRNSSPVGLGEIIADKYQIEGVIGEGGMGLVVSAWHLGLRQRVAIKLLLSDRGYIEQAALERFQREARAAARMRSEHVCRVLDVGALPGGTPYLVMEYLEGCDLSDELSRRGRLPADEAVGFVLEACEALAEAHLAGIIHRDLKPANLFLARRSDGSRCLKLLDFGVSKTLAEAGHAHFSLTKTSAIVGSPIYMSPEQLNSAKDVDARTDIWGTGALLFELLTGRTPFRGESIPQLVNAVLHSEPPSFAELGVIAPGGLETVVRRALAKSREQRFASMAELASALDAFAPEDSISVSRILRIRPPSEDRVPLPETIDDQDQIVQRTRRSAHNVTPPSRTPPVEANDRNQWKWAWIALALVALTGLAAALSRGLGGAPQAETAPSEAEGEAPPVVQLPQAPASPEPATGAQAPAPAQPMAPSAPAPKLSPEPSGQMPSLGASEDPAALRTVPRLDKMDKRPKPPSATTRTDSGNGISNFGGRR